MEVGIVQTSVGRPHFWRRRRRACEPFRLNPHAQAGRGTSPGGPPAPAPVHL